MGGGSVVTIDAADDPNASTDGWIGKRGGREREGVD